MFKYEQLWKPHAVEVGETLFFSLGALRLWIYRGQQEWLIAHELEAEKRNAPLVEVSDTPRDESREWTRWILDEKVEKVHLRPQLPNRPLIVRPELPMSLMPRKSVQFFIEIPLWVSVSFGSKHEQATEFPTMILSNSWFGSFIEGELCYAVKTTAKLSQADLLSEAHMAVFPLEVRNISSVKLNFERLCVRPQYLNIFGGDHSLWASNGRVSFRGEDKWGRIVYSSKAPQFDEASRLIGRAREQLRRGALLQTFDHLKQRVDLS